MKTFHAVVFVALLIAYSVYGDEADLDVPEVAVEEVESNRESCGKTGDDCEYKYKRCCDGYRCRYTGRTARLFICL